MKPKFGFSQQAKEAIKIKVEYCVKWNYRPDYECIRHSILDKYPGINIEGTGGASGALEVFVTLPEKEPKKVYSKLEFGDPRVKPHNVEEVIARVERYAGDSLIDWSSRLNNDDER